MLATRCQMEVEASPSLSEKHNIFVQLLNASTVQAAET